jgi:hypothetical protein
MEWLRKRIVAWLRVPTEVDMYYIQNCMFYRESPEDKPYLKKVGTVVKEHISKKKK